MDVGVTDFCY